jgi:RNA polymerase sigma-70 factor (ECF subfamily)
MPTSANEEVREPCGLTYQGLAHLSDEKIMLHLAAGHGDAVAVLFDRYSRLVLNIAGKIVQDHCDAEDLTQEIFVELCRTAARFDAAKGTAKMWLIRSAYRRSLNRRRSLKLRNAQILGDLGDLENYPSTEIGLAQALTPQESHRLARQMLGSLDAAQRRVIELVYFEGLSMKDVAERTGDSFASVRHRYYRGISEMRALVRKKNSCEPMTAAQETFDVQT